MHIANRIPNRTHTFVDLYVMTFEEVFKKLPEPFSTQAINNCLQGNLKAQVMNTNLPFFEALRFGFSWKYSNEGAGYWLHFEREVMPTLKLQIN